MDVLFEHSAPEWSREMNIKLILELQKRKSLWDPCSLEHKDKYQRKMDYQELSAIFQMPVSEVERRIHNLKRQFHREYRKSKVVSSTPYKSQWYGFQLMQFLVQKNSEKIPKPFHKNEVQNFRLNSESTVSSSTMSLPQNKSNLTCEKLLDKKDAFQYSKDNFYTTRSENVQHNQNRDEYTVFGEYVTFELRKISNPYAVSVAKHKIQESLFEAQMSIFSSMCDFNENGDSYFQYYSPNADVTASEPSTQVL